MGWGQQQGLRAPQGWQRALTIFLSFFWCRLGCLAVAVPGGGGEHRGAAGAVSARQQLALRGGGCWLPSQRRGCPGGHVRCQAGGPERMVAHPARCHPSCRLRSPRLSPNCRMTTSRAGRTTSPGMKVPLGWCWAGMQEAQCQPAWAGHFCLLPPWAFSFRRSGAGAGVCWEAAAGAVAAAQLQPQWCFVLGRPVASAAGAPLGGLPCTPTCPIPSLPPSPGHHQGPLPEGEVQPAQGVCGAGLPARHVHQPQEAGAQVGGWRGRG